VLGQYSNFLIALYIIVKVMIIFFVFYIIKYLIILFLYNFVITMYNYYFALASKNFLLNEEPLEEILRERIEYYRSNNKDVDFWFISDPYSIDTLKININIDNSYAAIISLDEYFIKWLKLRMSFIATGKFSSKSLFLFNS